MTWTQRLTPPLLVIASISSIVGGGLMPTPFWGLACDVLAILLASAAAGFAALSAIRALRTDLPDERRVRLVVLLAGALAYIGVVVAVVMNIVDVYGINYLTVLILWPSALVLLGATVVLPLISTGRRRGSAASQQSSSA